MDERGVRLGFCAVDVNVAADVVVVLAGVLDERGDGGEEVLDVGFQVEEPFADGAVRRLVRKPGGLPQLRRGCCQPGLQVDGV